MLDGVHWHLNSETGFGLLRRPESGGTFNQERKIEMTPPERFWCDVALAMISKTDDVENIFAAADHAVSEFEKRFQKPEPAGTGYAELESRLCQIAEIALRGGTMGYGSEEHALTEIRRISLPWFNKNGSEA